MPSIEESKRRVKAGLNKVNNEIDHDAILANLEREFEEHNDVMKNDTQDGEHASTGRFRFKTTTSIPRKRKHSPARRRRHHHHKRRSDRHEHDSEQESAHPFLREPIVHDHESPRDPHAAFRESLFDALADDEGAAYWESVYSQPIHVYPRPTVKTPQGELEEMNDDDYAAYVQTKMWEKKNPHIVHERDRRAKRRKQEEEEKIRRKEEFVRRKQRAAWERAQTEGAGRFAGIDGDEEADGHEYVFDPAATMSTESNSSSRQQGEQNTYCMAWSKYLDAWDRLKHDLLAKHGSTSHDVDDKGDAEKQIPWPVLSRKPVVKENIEDFMRWIAVAQDGKSRLQLLKVERVRWHPDKMQQRFRGHIGEGTVKLITSVFQVVDALFETERGREDKMT